MLTDANREERKPISMIGVWHVNGLETWRETSINPQIDSCYVACCGAGKKGNRVGNLVQLPDSPEGNLGEQR